MTTITDELERFRQQMIEDARENEVELVRLAADLEKAELGLIAQLRSVIQAHEQRREMFMAELRGFAGRMALPNTAQVSPALSSLPMAETGIRERSTGRIRVRAARNLRTNSKRTLLRSVPNTVVASVRRCFSFSTSLTSRSHKQRSNDPDGKCHRNDFDDLNIHDTTCLTSVSRKRSRSQCCVTDADIERTMKSVSTLKPNEHGPRNSSRSLFKCQGSRPLEIS